MGILDELLGTPRQSPIGTLSSLSTMNLGASGFDPSLGTIPGMKRVRVGSPTGGLAPGNGWGDAATATPIGGILTPTTATSTNPSADADSAGATNTHPSFFQAGGTMSKLAPIIGAISDAISTSTGGRPMYATMMKAQQDTQDADVDRQYKRAQMAKLLSPPQPKVGTFQEKVNDLRANGATDADIANLVQNTTNPFQAVPGHDEQGRPTLTMMRPGAMVGGIPPMSPSTAAPDAGEDLPVGTIVNGHRYMGGGIGNQANWQATGGASPSGGATFSRSAAYDAVIQQESGGRAGAVGPQTRYGRAQGNSQMLPATAQAMAAKIGVPWVPSMMTGTAPDAADYQRSLGQAYFDEGLSKTGNIYDAARYYFAGPNRALWGPKTTRYADSIIARLGTQ